MPIDYKIKIKNYKCFGEIEQGFDCIHPINIIIGRNNSGKSSLIDLIQYIISPDEELFRLGHLGKTPEVFITQPLTENELKSVFSPSMSGGGVPGNNHWEFGKKWIGVNITYKLIKGDKEFHSLEKPFSYNHPEHQQDGLIRKLTNPFETKLFRRISSERDIVRELDSNVPQNIPELKSNGSGATNLIHNFLSNRAFNSRDLVRKIILAELNRIVEPDLRFTEIVSQKDLDSHWEIILERTKKVL